MASLRSLAWKTVRVAAGSLLDHAVQKVRQLSVDFLITRFTVGAAASYSVWDECKSWRQTLKRLATLLTEDVEWQIVFRDAAGAWWYRTYTGKAPPL